MGGLIQSETVHVPTAQTTTPTTKHAAMCMRMFFPRSLWTGMWMSQLFLELQRPQSAGYCLYYSTWIVVRSAEATPVITQPTRIIHDSGS